ncbi:MAG: P22 phage major capsid protein family protein [Candidatus Melainabacteria bacterium]|nr:P22 phage major capsid protein family protein [Candidatus Melainabacteria bacterium]
MPYPANFIPEVWSKKLLKIFDKTTVMANVVNRDFEGEITSAGDVVHVRTFGDVTINDYTRDMTISFQTLTDPMVDLTIDQQKYFAFKVDDLDKAQADINILEGYAARGAIAIRNVVDSRLLAHYADLDTNNKIGTDGSPITLSKTNIYAYITDLAQMLDEDNVPQEDRSLVIPPKLKTLLLQSEEFTRATNLGDRVVQNGYIGNVAGFAVHVTTNMAPVSGVYNVLALHRDAISFASQVSKVETVRPYNMFAEAVKGLYLYGSKVMLPKGGAVLKANAS